MKEITEITESDFRKLDLKGYLYEKLVISSQAHKMKFMEHSLNDELDKEKKYVQSNPTWSQKIAFFVTSMPTEEDIKEQYLMLQGIKNEKERNEVAYGMALMNVSNQEKYYWNRLGTFTAWCGVKHIYSKRNKWLIDADSECGELHKKLIKRIYIVSLGE